MGKLLLFQWTGYAPREAQVAHRCQVSCAAVFPSKAAFMRATDRKRSEMPYISVTPLRESDDYGNEGARLAAESPGTVFYHDTLRHSHREAKYLVHPEPERS